MSQGLCERLGPGICTLGLKKLVNPGPEHQETGSYCLPGAPIPTPFSTC